MTLVVTDATRRFGRRQVFSGLNVTLSRGETLLLGGPNGAGKTTLLRCLAGTLTLSAGSVTMDGSWSGTRAFSARVGVCSNAEHSFYQRLSGHDNLVFAARLRLPAGHVDPAVESIEAELAITAFAAGRVQEYSSGMRARIAIARALLGRPSLLLLDEPTRSLDVEGCELFWSALERRSVACVIASHRPSDRARCNRTLILGGPS